MIYVIGLILLFFIYYWKSKEHFYTFFIPNIVEPVNPYPRYIYDNNAYSISRFFPKQKTAVLWLWDSYMNLPTEWLNPWFSWLLSVLPLQPFQIQKNTNWDTILTNVSQNPNHMAIVPLWKLYTEQTRKLNPKTVTGVMNLYSHSIYVIVPYTDKITQFNPKIFAEGTTWGVGPKDELSSFIAERFKTTWYESPKGPTLFSDSWDQCIQMIKNNQLNGIIWCDVYPSSLFLKIQNILPRSSYQLLPIYLEQHEILRNSNPQLRSSYLRLNEMNRNYLPMQVGTHTYWFWNDELETIQFPSTWIANSNYPQEDIYNWLNHFMNNERWTKNKLLFQSQWTKSRSFDFGFNLPIHSGARQYMIEHGYLSQQNNAECVLYAGSTECKIPNIPPASQPV